MSTEVETPGAAGSSGVAPTSTGGAAPAGAAGEGGSTAIYSSPTAGSTGSVSVGWGDDWRIRMAGGSSNEKEIKQLQRYESPEQVWRKARELEAKLSAGELRPILRKDATPDEIAAYRKANGIPDKPEGYKITMPQGREAPPEDDAFLKGVLNTAHQANYTQEQLDALIGTFYKQVDQQIDQIKEAEEQAIAAAEDTLRQEWGPDYRTNKALAEALLARAPAGFRDKFLNGYLDDHTPIRASAEAWKWLVQIEREINPAGTVVPQGSDVGKSIEAELGELKKQMKDPTSDYWKGPNAEKMQARYRELITAQEKIAARAG